MEGWRETTAEVVFAAAETPARVLCVRLINADVSEAFLDLQQFDAGESSGHVISSE